MADTTWRYDKSDEFGWMPSGGAPRLQNPYQTNDPNLNYFGNALAAANLQPSTGMGGGDLGGMDLTSMWVAPTPPPAAVGTGATTPAASVPPPQYGYGSAVSPTLPQGGGDFGLGGIGADPYAVTKTPGYTQDDQGDYNATRYNYVKDLPPDFDPYQYKKNNPDIGDADPIQHYMTVGKNQGLSYTGGAGFIDPKKHMWTKQDPTTGAYSYDPLGKGFNPDDRQWWNAYNVSSDDYTLKGKSMDHYGNEIEGAAPPPPRMNTLGQYIDPDLIDIEYGSPEDSDKPWHLDGYRDSNGFERYTWSQKMPVLPADSGTFFGDLLFGGGASGARTAAAVSKMLPAAAATVMSLGAGAPALLGSAGATAAGTGAGASATGLTSLGLSTGLAATTGLNAMGAGHQGGSSVGWNDLLNFGLGAAGSVAAPYIGGALSPYLDPITGAIKNTVGDALSGVGNYLNVGAGQGLDPITGLGGGVYDSATAPIPISDSGVLEPFNPSVLNHPAASGIGPVPLDIGGGVYDPNTAPIPISDSGVIDVTNPSVFNHPSSYDVSLAPGDSIPLDDPLRGQMTDSSGKVWGSPEEMSMGQDFPYGQGGMTDAYGKVWGSPDELGAGVEFPPGEGGMTDAYGRVWGSPEEMFAGQEWKGMPWWSDIGKYLSKIGAWTKYIPAITALLNASGVLGKGGTPTTGTPTYPPPTGGGAAGIDPTTLGAMLARAGGGGRGVEQAPSAGAGGSGTGAGSLEAMLAQLKNEEMNRQRGYYFNTGAAPQGAAKG